MNRTRLAWMTLMLLGVTGCRHRKAPVIPVQAQAPVALEPTPNPKLPTEVASVPPQPAPVPTVELPKKKPHKTHHKPAATAPVTPVPTPPVQVASAEPPPPIASVIGSLSTGGEAGPERLQQASDLIANNEKRLKALSTQIVEQQRSAVARVGNFDRDASVALKAGDAEGALTLAKKAQVLLDDLEK